MTYVLPPQQLEVLRLVAAGVSQAEISRRLHITTDTVQARQVRDG